MCKVAAAQIRRWVGFFPRDVVEDFVAELLHRKTDAENDVMRASNPNCTVGFQNFLAALEPFEIEFVIQFRAARFVPIAFVHFDHPPGVTTDAAVGKEIRRVGKDAIKPAFGILRGYGVEQFKRVAVVNP